MTTTLCFDFGNTRLKCAVFANGDLKAIETLPDGGPSIINGLLEKYHPSKSLLSSVINHHPELEEILRQKTTFHKLDHFSKIPVTTPVGKPETIGADRLAMVVAAAMLYPEKNNVAIGLGTAITYNFINRKKEFLGGGISPGMEMRFKSLHELTAKLPLIEKNWNFPLIGYDTRTNILSGVILGMAKEIDGMIDLYHEKFANLNVVLTGGDAAYFARHLKNRIFVDADLLFKGLYAISELNNV